MRFVKMQLLKGIFQLTCVGAIDKGAKAKRKKNKKYVVSQTHRQTSNRWTDTLYTKEDCKSEEAQTDTC